MTRPWIWDRLDAVTQERVIDYLAPVVGDDTYPKTNWLWFRVVVQTFLRSVGGPWSAADIADDLALHDSLVREDGWMSDGFERSYDHYIGWAMHLYPVLWARMQGAAELAAGRTASDVVALDRFLAPRSPRQTDGSPVIRAGASSTLRHAAPFWIGAIARLSVRALGRLRHAEPRRRPLRRQRRPDLRRSADDGLATNGAGLRSRTPARAPPLGRQRTDRHPASG
jgi:hypothetical protein